jgi:hypothetical protein
MRRHAGALKPLPTPPTKWAVSKALLTEFCAYLQCTERQARKWAKSAKSPERFIAGVMGRQYRLGKLASLDNAYGGGDRSRLSAVVRTASGQPQWRSLP